MDVMDITKKKSPWHKLFSAPIEDLNTPEYTKLISQLKDAWAKLANRHFEVTPLASQDPEAFFWHTYHLQNESIAIDNERFQAALRFGHFMALEKVCEYHLGRNEFAAAIEFANRAGEIYLSAGFALLAEMHLAAARATEGDERKHHFKNIIKALKLVSLFFELHQSQIAIDNMGLEIDDVWFRDFMSDCDALSVILSEQENKAIDSEVEQEYQKLLNPSSHRLGHPNI